VYDLNANQPVHPVVRSIQLQLQRQLTSTVLIDKPMIETTEGLLPSLGSYEIQNNCGLCLFSSGIEQELEVNEDVFLANQDQFSSFKDFHSRVPRDVWILRQGE
jgi:hypothetical protein